MNATAALTIAQRRVLAGVAAAPRPINAREVRANMGLPCTTRALEAVQAGLADLVSLGEVVRHLQPTGYSTYTVALQPGHPVHAADTDIARGHAYLVAQGLI